MQRGRGFEPGDHIGVIAKEGLHEAGCFSRIFRSRHSAGQKDSVRAHRGDVDFGFWHGQREHLINAVNVVAHAHIGRPDDVACLVAGINGGFAACTSENIELALRFYLHIGDCVIRHENVGHLTRNAHQFTAANRQNNVLRRANNLLCGRGSRDRCSQRCKREASNHHAKL